jgi:hypothetical protein
MRKTGVLDLRNAFEEEDARRLFANADDVPTLIRRLGGGLADRVRDRLIEKIAGDAVTREAIRSEAEMRRRELEGDRPTAIERLLVEQVVVAWLDAERCILVYYAFGEGMSKREEREIAAHVARMRNAANRNHTATLKALALIRKAAPCVTINVTKSVNVTRGERSGRHNMNRLTQPSGN